MKCKTWMQALCLASVLSISVQAALANGGAGETAPDCGPWDHIPHVAVPAVSERPVSGKIEEKDGRWLVSEDALHQYGLYRADGKKGTYWLRLPPAKDGLALWDDDIVALRLPAQKSEDGTAVNIRYIQQSLGIPYTWTDGQKEIQEPLSPTRLIPRLRSSAGIETDVLTNAGKDKEKKKHKKSHAKKEQSMGLVLFWDPVMQLNEDLPSLDTAQPVMSPCAFRLTGTGVELRHDELAMLENRYAEQGYAMWPLVDNSFDPALTHAILSDDQLQETIIKELIGYAVLYKFNGYNIDFENINYSDKDRLTAFVARLSQACRAYGLKISMDVTPISNSMNWSRVYDREALAPHLDYMMLMAYDQFGRTSPVAGPVASYPWVEQAVQGVTAIVPSEKVILGMPLYMRIWYETDDKKDLPLDINEWPDVVSKEETAKEETTKEGEDSMKADAKKDTRHKPKKRTLLVRTLPMSASELLFKKYKDYITWNDELKLYYMDLPLKTGRVQVWFEDTKSLAEKTKLIAQYALGGASFWRKGFESPQFWKRFAPQELT